MKGNLNLEAYRNRIKTRSVRQDRIKKRLGTFLLVGQPI